MGDGYPQLWTVTEDVLVSIGPFYDYFDLILLQASLFSAVLYPVKDFTPSTSR